MRPSVLIFFLFISFTSFGQYQSNWFIEPYAGTCSYNGDLVQGAFPLKRLKPGGGINFKKDLSTHIAFRAGISYGRIYGNDKKNKDPELVARNLSFNSHVIELAAGLEYSIYNIEEYFMTPYIYGGLGVFHFNPYAFDDAGNKTFLKPLSTEGQGLADYPNRKPYSLYQFCIPLGVGFKWKPEKKDWWISYEFNYRITFTDYIDDVSSTYVSLEKLLAAKGPKAVELSFREKNVDFARRLGDTRGFSKPNDTYYYNVIKLSIPFGNYYRLQL